MPTILLSPTRAALRAGTASLVLGLALMTPAHAQQAPSATPVVPQSTTGLQPNAANADASTAAEEIVVTGSRIARPNLEGASPVTVVTSADVAVQGTVRTEDLLNSLPQVFAGQGSTLANGATGTATVDLRGLGPQRTLVLVNGRRLMPGDPTLPVADLNFIPSQLISRVDVLTGGASAVYGADAVAGVVNFVMDTKFEGVRIDAQYSFLQHNNRLSNELAAANRARNFSPPLGNEVDGSAFDTSLVIGASGADGRAHVQVYAGYRKVNPVFQRDRSYSYCGLTSTTSPTTLFTCGGSGTTDPARFISDGGDSTLAATGGPGALRPYTSLDAYNFNPINYFQRPDERFTLGGFASYELSEHFEPYAEVMFMDDRSLAQIAPSGTFLNAYNIPCNSPLLSAQQVAEFCTASGLTADVNPATGLSDFASVIIGKRNVEGGPRVSDLRHTAYRIVTGVRGEITDGWRYDLYGQYGKTLYTQRYEGDFSFSRLNNALAVIPNPAAPVGGLTPVPNVAAGAPVCLTSTQVNGDLNCVPYNIFQLNGVTPQAINYVQVPGIIEGSNTEQIVSGSITGDLGSFKSPFANDGIGISVGAEYRTQSLESNPDLAFQSGDLAGQGGPQPQVRGKYTVKEVFGEVRIPIVQDVPFFQSLVFEGGYRYSDYSLSGNTSTYKLAGEWEPVSGIRVRGGYNRAVRAPNLLELFTPATIGLFSGQDPCAGPTPTFTAEQCARTGVPAALYGAVLDNPAGQYNQVTGGSLSLSPEKADTYTLGVVLAPRGGALRGLALAVDFFDIKIEDVISGVPTPLLSSQQIVNFCGQTGLPEFCSLINRDSRGTIWLGQAGFVRNTAANLGSLKTQGIDIDANYRFDLDNVGVGGGLNFQLNGTYLRQYRVASLPNAIPGIPESYDCVGFYGATCGVPTPEWRHRLRVTYTSPTLFSVAVTWRHFGPVTSDLANANANGGEAAVPNPGDARIKAQNYIDLALTADVTKSATFRVGVNNVFDRQPPVVGSQQAPTNGNTFSQVYDSLGRYIFVGGSFRF